MLTKYTKVCSYILRSRIHNKYRESEYTRLLYIVYILRYNHNKTQKILLSLLSDLRITQALRFIAERFCAVRLRFGILEAFQNSFRLSDSCLTVKLFNCEAF